MKRTLAKLVILSSMVVLLTGLAYAGPLSGNITSTLTITRDTWLTGNVTCNVATGTECIVFGSSFISLELNGFTITGKGATGVNRGSCPTGVVPGEAAIDTNFKNFVLIEGPGLIGEFRERGIVVTGSNSQVENVVVSSTCSDGIDVFGSHNEIDYNKVVRASLSGGFLSSIFVSGPGSHAILHNKIAGSGPLPLPPAQGGQGIFIGGPTGSPTGNNLIEGNFIGGLSSNGISFASSKDAGFADTHGNQVIDNSAFGNLNLASFDIMDDNSPGANFYQDNACETSAGPGAPTCPNLPEPPPHHDGFGNGKGGGGDGHHDKGKRK
jgi:hypothetical protein